MFRHSHVSWIPILLLFFCATGRIANAAVQTIMTPTIPDVGARVPFVTLEAEDAANTTNGRIIRLQKPPANNHSAPELEASGRAYVELTREGDTLELPVPVHADTIVLRHCIPDTPEGGGQSATLCLLVNDQPRQTLTLTSKHNWIYHPAKPSKTPGLKPNPNDPATGTPRAFWDETRFRISGPALKPGDRLQFRKTTADTTAYYRIDLLDLEQAPPPLLPPSPGTYLSVLDFGARPDDDTDDTAAIKACIDAAMTQKKTVWFPPGVYHHNQQFRLDGVKLRGAGMWHTALIGTANGSVRDFGFRIAGDGAEVRDLFIENAIVDRRGSGAKAFTSARSDSAINWRVENVWVTHSHVGFWMSGAHDGIVRGCRVRFTFADSLTFNSGSSRNFIEHNHVRGSGDDGIATLSETTGGRHKGIAGSAVSTGNIFRHNTIVANWWGHNADLAGGTGHVFENNYLADNSAMGCLTINHPIPFPMHDLTDSVIRGNVIVRGGGRITGQLRGAVWIYTGSASARNILIEDNHILDSLYRGIHLTGPATQEIRFVRNRIINPGAEGVYIDKLVTGSGVFENNYTSGATAVPFRNDAAATAYNVSSTDNNW